MLFYDMDFITILLVILLLLFREGLHFIERRDMLDRLMARSLPEFKDNATPEDNHLEDAPDDGTVPIEEAEDELVREDDGKEEN